MSPTLRRRKGLRLPTGPEAALAAQAARQLEAQFPNGDTASILILSPTGNGEPIELPIEALACLKDALVQMGEGAALQLAPVRPELTTQEAADLLNVSRPYLIELLDAGEIPFRKMGTHRRIPAPELLEYREKLRREGRKAAAELTAEAQRLDLGY